MDQLLAEELCPVSKLGNRAWIMSESRKEWTKFNPRFQLEPRIAPSVPQRRSQLMSCTEKRMSAYCYARTKPERGVCTLRKHLTSSPCQITSILTKLKVGRRLSLVFWLLRVKETYSWIWKIFHTIHRGLAFFGNRRDDVGTDEREDVKNAVDALRAVRWHLLRGWGKPLQTICPFARRSMCRLDLSLAIMRMTVRFMMNNWTEKA